MAQKHSFSQTIVDVVTTKCPACREGQMFYHPPYKLHKLLKMRHTCPVCGQDFKQEPGFYFGSMYFSYALNIAIMVIFGLSFELLFAPEEIWKTLVSVLLPAILLVPVTYRLSKSMMLYFFGKIQKQK